MGLTLVGLGLVPGDLSLKGLRRCEQADYIGIETYTSALVTEEAVAVDQFIGGNVTSPRPVSVANATPT